MKENRLAPITGWIRRDVFPTLFTESLTELRLWHEEGADVIPVVTLAAYTAACTSQPGGQEVLPPPSYMLPHMNEYGVEIMGPTPLWSELAVRSAIAHQRQLLESTKLFT